MNHVLRRLFIIAALTALLAGCGTYGKNFDHTRVNQIKNNVTTPLVMPTTRSLDIETHQDLLLARKLLQGEPAA